MECSRVDKIQQVVSPLAVIAAIFWVTMPHNVPFYGLAFLVGMALSFVVYRNDIYIVIFQK